jgi:hypothetical protein
MSAYEILKTWPGFATALPEEIFAHPAWVMPCQWGDERCFLCRSAAKPRDVIGLSIKLDDDEHFLGLANRERFPDLHQLWTEKRRLPDALLLALVEKECGDLLQLIENVVRRQVSVLGLDDPAKRASAVAFDVIGATDGAIRATFVLDVKPSMVRTFGQLRFLDTNHPSLRELTRPARAVYATFDLSEMALGSLAAGDYLLLPELAAATFGEWAFDLPADTRCRVVAPTETTLTFAACADQRLPACPRPTALDLAVGNRVIARGRLAQLCNQLAFEIEEVL